MVSLNDIDAQLASLEASDNESVLSDSSADADSSLIELKSKKSKKRVLDDNMSSTLLKKKRRKGHSTICWQFFKGSCKFDDCAFRHVSPAKLDPVDKLEMMRELRVKTFDADLARAIRDLNIPSCKTFAKTGECKFAVKCQYWHLTDGKIARWAGFDFWCQPCRKAFTSQSQLDEHQKGRVHKENSQ